MKLAISPDPLTSQTGPGMPCMKRGLEPRLIERIDHLLGLTPGDSLAEIEEVRLDASIEINR